MGVVVVVVVVVVRLGVDCVAARSSTCTKGSCRAGIMACEGVAIFRSIVPNRICGFER